MHQAASKGQLDILMALLEAGGRVDVKTSKGKTPLDLAAQFKKDDCMKALTQWAAGRTAERMDTARACSGGSGGRRGRRARSGDAEGRRGGAAAR